MASVAELKKSFFAEIDKVENREDLAKLRVKYLGRENRQTLLLLRTLCCSVQDHLTYPLPTWAVDLRNGISMRCKQLHLPA